MTKKPLDPEGQFTVGEAKTINYVIAIFFLGLFGYGVFDAIRRNFHDIDYQSYVFAFAIIPAIIAFRKANSQTVYIRINKTGIYQQERLVTRWDSLLKANLGQDENKKMFDPRDRFVLVLEYRRDGKILRRQLPLTNTQNKSEEEVLEAVKFFWNIDRIYQ